MTKSSDWTVDTLKEYFDRLIKEKDEDIRKAEERITQILGELPQAYGSKTDLDKLEDKINTIKADHVQRTELAALKDSQAQGRGIRTAVSIGMGIVVALISVALAAMYANQLTHHDVSSQIERESPWAKDRPGIENELKTLEKQVLVLNTELERHKAEDRLRAALAKKR